MRPCVSTLTFSFPVASTARFHGHRLPLLDPYTDVFDALEPHDRVAAKHEQAGLVPRLKPADHPLREDRPRGVLCPRPEQLLICPKAEVAHRIELPPRRTCIPVGSDHQPHSLLHEGSDVVPLECLGPFTMCRVVAGVGCDEGSVRHGDDIILGGETRQRFTYDKRSGVVVRAQRIAGQVCQDLCARTDRNRRVVGRLYVRGNAQAGSARPTNDLGNERGLQPRSIPYLALTS